MTMEKAPKEYTFTAWGHPNIRATHPTTLMFTKDPECTVRGDCIVGVRADFDFDRLRSFLGGKAQRMRMTIGWANHPGKENIEFMSNVDFNHPAEIVVRKGGFLSNRTLGTSASHASSGLSRAGVVLMRDPLQEMRITMNKI
ncbi:MAG TPA: DUF371 domain-containing protein [Candidatus Nanoarchaeia archaeon]|nr:DUF371 domain-containing protein [Candidatus Nanoarchaeia archaeon]